VVVSRLPRRVRRDLRRSMFRSYLLAQLEHRQTHSHQEGEERQLERVPGFETQDSKSQRHQSHRFQKHEDQDRHHDLLQLGFATWNHNLDFGLGRLKDLPSTWPAKLTLRSTSSLSKFLAPRVSWDPTTGSLNVTSWLLMNSSTWSSSEFSLRLVTSLGL
jgi:hypothetical protein